MRLFSVQNRHVHALRDPVGSDIQKYCVFSMMFDMDMRTYRVFSSSSALPLELLLLSGGLFEAILEVFSLPKCIQKSVFILRGF